jgi:hypothetical protein
VCCGVAEMLQICHSVTVVLQHCTVIVKNGVAVVLQRCCSCVAKLSNSVTVAPQIHCEHHMSLQGSPTRDCKRDDGVQELQSWCQSVMVMV